MTKTRINNNAKIELVMAIKLTIEKESALAALKPFLGLFPDYYSLTNHEFSEPAKVDDENYWKYILV